LIISKKTTDNSGYRAINEIKAWFPNKKKYWYEIAKQLKKYDDELTDWKFNSDKKHDIMLTTDSSFTNKFKQYLEQLGSTNEIKIDRSFVIMESYRKERANHSFFIRKFSGNISNKKLDDAFSDGIDVPMQNIVRELDKLKFYDSEPPYVYMMMIMWDHIFSKYINSRKKQDDLNSNKTVDVILTVDQIYEKLSKFTHESNPHCIEKSWIKNALNRFVDIKIAEESVTNPNKFTIKFRKHSEETLDFFINKFQKLEKPKKDAKSEGPLDEYIKKEKAKTA